MSDEQDGVRITITVEVIENGEPLPAKIEQWVLDPTIVGDALQGLNQRAQLALPRIAAMSVHALRPQLPLRVCEVCRYYAVIEAVDEKGKHHPACEHAPPNPRNAGPRYRSPAVYEGNADWEPRIRVCAVCKDFAIMSPGADKGEHHPACTHHGRAGDSDPDPV